MSAASIVAEVEGVGGQPVSAQTIQEMHKKARKQFTEDKQTKDMDYWNYVLWSDETKFKLIWFRWF